jgi:hypothetical protein
MSVVANVPTMNISEQDYEAFMAGDDVVTLSDGVVIEIHDDPDGYLSAGDFEDIEQTEYVGTIVRDPVTGFEDAIWGTGLSMNRSGRENRQDLWNHVVAGFYNLLGTVRAEVSEREYWAARGVPTVTR